MIGIRADGNDIIATGHIMRCMAIGARLQEMGQEVMFFLAGDEMKELVESRGFQVQVLGTDWQHMEEELDVFLPLLESFEIHHLLLDSYQVTVPYLKSLKQRVKVTYIDDLQIIDYPVDNIICYSVYSEEEKEQYRQKFSWSQNLYLGLKYIPLRKEFEGGYYKNENIESDIDASNSKAGEFFVTDTVRDIAIRDILITTGGTDSFHMALGIVEHLEQYNVQVSHDIQTAHSIQDKCNTTTANNTHTILEKKGYHYHVIVGKFHPDKKKLQEMSEHMPYLHVYENVVDMTTLMNQCDIAISAGGTTIFELCACGVPVLSFMMADNQKGIEALDKLGLLKNMGDVRYEREKVLENISMAIRDWEANPENLLEISRFQRSMVDTKGAVRIAQIIGGLQTENL